MLRAKTDSFTEFPLPTTTADEKILATRLRAAGHIYSAVLGEALCVLGLMRESKERRCPALEGNEAPAREAARTRASPGR
ncbi:MAG TPA: hypothetical protein VMK12_23325 [Anaeromyxobacteraceae bacterium]|nr:hypothetical protein [Anaeromyxobacteraceae bacterium]